MNYSVNLEKYVKSIERACVEGREYVVVLKHEKGEEAVKKILSKGKVLREVPSMVLVRYNNVDLSISTGGRLIVKNVINEEGVKEVLNKLLS